MKNACTLFCVEAITSGDIFNSAECCTAFTMFKKIEPYYSMCWKRPYFKSLPVATYMRGNTFNSPLQFTQSSFLALQSKNLFFNRTLPTRFRGLLTMEASMRSKFLTLALASGEGADAPPWAFLKWPPSRWAYRANILHSLWGSLCAAFGKKDRVRSGHGATTS